MDEMRNKLSRLPRNWFFLGCLIASGGFFVADIVMIAGVLLTDPRPLGQRTVIRGFLAGLPFGFLFMVSFLALLWSALRRTGADRAVVWLRRFHQHESSRFPLPEYLTMLGVGRFQVATIQDTKFQFSFLTGMTRSALAIITFQVVATLSFFLLSLGVLGKLTSLKNSSPLTLLILSVFVGIAIQAVALRAFAKSLARRRGVEILKSAKDIRRLVRWFERVQGGIGHVVPGLKIFKCSDEFWTDAVVVMLQRCNAAIIDISDLNENMRWELLQSIELVPPQRLILAYSVDAGLYPADPSDDLVAQVEAVIGTDCLSEVWFWCYPEPLPLRGGKAVMSEEAEAHVYETLDLMLKDVLLEQSPDRDEGSTGEGKAEIRVRQST